jgi:hypothetical protein
VQVQAGEEGILDGVQSTALTSDLDEVLSTLIHKYGDV